MSPSKTLVARSRECRPVVLDVDRDLAPTHPADDAELGPLGSVGDRVEREVRDDLAEVDAERDAARGDASVVLANDFVPAFSASMASTSITSERTASTVASASIVFGTLAPIARRAIMRGPSALLDDPERAAHLLRRRVGITRLADPTEHDGQRVRDLVEGAEQIAFGIVGHHSSGLGGGGG